MSEPRLPVEVAVDKLRYRCPPDSFDFESTETVDGSFEIIGQERAIKAIKLGLAVASRGYNLLVQGLTGTGKETTVKSILEQVAHDARIPQDICYAYNFDDPDQPVVLYLAPGEGCQLRRDMERLVDYLDRTVPAVLESDEFKKRRTQIIEKEGTKERGIVKEFEEKIKRENFVLVEVRFGPMTKTDIAPIVDGKPRTGDELEEMLAEGEISREDFEVIDRKREVFATEMEEVLQHAKDSEKQISEALKALAYGFGAEIINPSVDELKAKYKGEKIRKYLENVRHHVLENLESFLKQEESDGSSVASLMQGQRDRFLPYRINVIVDNGEAKRAPIVVETHPTYRNLFGAIERSLDRSGASQTDFTRITAGSLLRAAGGYVVLSFLEVLSEPGVYQSLKRTLKSGKVDIQGFDPTNLYTSSALKPEPIDIDVKVVLIGDAKMYQVFYNMDPDFRKVFKVKADFESTIDRDEASVQRYASFIARIIHSENLLHFDRSAVAAVIEEGVRLAGRQKKLSSQFSDIADLVRETTYWARQSKVDIVSAEHVERAVTERVERRNLVETRIGELIHEGVIMIDCMGERVGQVNGLSVYDLGDYKFGKPTKITATVATGRAGIINIERESDLSGRSHNKGILILSGYFRSRFAQRRPVTLSASLAFEQSYGGVDGDSASSTELYALLSALAGLPIRQDIAVTGSVNQKGEIQAIGGVNEKIEGFFDTCQAAGLTGRQGVMIPDSNISELMLRRDIVASVAAGRFHIYSVANVEQGIEILTGVAVGKATVSGLYPDGSVYGLVEKRLKQMAKDMRIAMKGEEKNAEEEMEEK